MSIRIVNSISYLIYMRIHLHIVYLEQIRSIFDSMYSGFMYLNAPDNVYGDQNLAQMVISKAHGKTRN